MASPDPVLERLYENYRRAVDRCRGRQLDLSAVDELLTARVVLYEHLQRSGWTPPEPVRRQLDLDALLLEQPPSLVAG